HEQAYAEAHQEQRERQKIDLGRGSGGRPRQNRDLCDHGCAPGRPTTAPAHANAMPRGSAAISSFMEATFGSSNGQTVDFVAQRWGFNGGAAAAVRIYRPVMHASGGTDHDSRRMRHKRVRAEMQA